MTDNPSGRSIDNEIQRLIDAGISGGSIAHFLQAERSKTIIEALAALRKFGFPDRYDRYGFFVPSSPYPQGVTVADFVDDLHERSKHEMVSLLAAARTARTHYPEEKIRAVLAD